jgi:hypothetical protein
VFPELAEDVLAKRRRPSFSRLVTPLGDRSQKEVSIIPSPDRLSAPTPSSPKQLRTDQSLTFRKSTQIKTKGLSQRAPRSARKKRVTRQEVDASTASSRAWAASRSRRKASISARAGSAA